METVSETTISAGKVLTLALLKRVNKAAYQFGGFKTAGGINKKTYDNLEAKTKIIIESKYIECDINKFMDDFNKTMNAWYYIIEVKQ